MDVRNVDEHLTLIHDGEYISSLRLASRLIPITPVGLDKRVWMSLAVVGTAVLAVVVSLGAMLGFGKPQWDPRGKVRY